jgi:linoleate 10R-lipoxygenase
MSRFLTAVNKDLELVHMSGEPVDLDGARKVPSVLTKKIQDVIDFAQRGSPVSISDLVSIIRPYEFQRQQCYVQPAFIDAAKNMTSVGLNDRKLLVSKYHLPGYFL